VFDNIAAGTDYLFFSNPQPLNFLDTIQWQFLIRYSYLPSSSNHWMFYLACGDTLPCNSCQSKALALGVNATGYDDILKLYAITSTGIKEFLNTSLNWEKAVADSIALIKITRFPEGKYQILLYIQNRNVLSLLTNTTDSSFIPASNYFGISYTYTSSQDRKLWIDDVAIHSRKIENFHLKVDSFRLTTDSTLEIDFNNEFAAGILNNKSFEISPKLDLNKVEIIGNTIILTTQSPFMFNIPYSIALKNIKDCFGHIMADTIIRVVNAAAQPLDIVFSELLIDPEPPVSLPQFEYIECYNRSERDINLKDWSICLGSSTIKLPDIVFSSKSYFIFTSKSAIGEFDKYGNVCYCLPSGSFLSNEAGTVLLKDNRSKLICNFFYNSDYFSDVIKKDGGWSLELVNTNNPCSDRDNWKFSINFTGGTPGESNSLTENNTNIEIPIIEGLSVPTDSTCTIFFNKCLSPSSLNPYTFTISNVNPVQVSFFENKGNAILLKWPFKFIKSMKYMLQISDNACDCSDNKLKDTSISFTLPVSPDSGKLLINEILFDVSSIGEEFIELYNNSDTMLDIGNIIITELNFTTEEIENYTSPLPSGFLLPARSFIAITNDARKVQNRYKPDLHKNIISWNNIFQLSNDSAILSLRTRAGKEIDRVRYSSKWQFVMLGQTKNVSIERMCAACNGMDRNNWHSASSTENYATPGYQNSQSLPSTEQEEKWLNLSSRTFSPNNDGVDDVLIFTVKLTQSSALLTLSVYTAGGYLVRHIAQQQYIGTNSTFTWDGTASGKLLSPGIYVIYARIMDNKKVISETKTTCTIAY
jgi:hypothetical protein